jgi:hypothetical protein
MNLPAVAGLVSGLALPAFSPTCNDDLRHRPKASGKQVLTPLGVMHLYFPAPHHHHHHRRRR